MVGVIGLGAYIAAVWFSQVGHRRKVGL